MKIAIIGTGNVAQFHAAAIKQLGYSIEVCVNPVKDLAFMQKWGIIHFANSVEEALNYDFDVAHICTPPALHYEQVKTLLEHGKHIVCEKPFCLTNHEAKELTALAKAKGCVNAVCFNNRFYDAIKKAKQEMKGEEIQLFCGTYFQAFHVLPCDYSWRYDEKLTGKMRAACEISPHVIDLMCFLTGKKVKSVSALFQKNHVERALCGGVMYAQPHSGESIVVNSEDSAIITFILDNNAIASIVVSEACQGKQNELKIHLQTDHSTIEWNNENPYFLHIAKQGEVKSVNFSFGGGFSETFVPMIQDVYKAIDDKTHRGAFCDFEQASENVNISNAIYDSAMTNGKFVHLV